MPKDPLQIAVSIAAVGLLIAWHEFGHYVVARLLGVRVLRYSIGFGPRLWKLGFRRGEIDYQIGVFPVGGFVQMKGMTPLEEGAVADPRSFIMRPRWVRWLVLAAGPAFNYLLGAALFFVYLWAWPSPVATPAVEVGVIPGGAAAAAGVHDGDFVTHVDGQIFGSTADFRALVNAKNGGAVHLDVLRDGQPLSFDVTPKTVEGGSGYFLGVQPDLRQPAAGVFQTAALAVTGCYRASADELSAIAALFRREPGVQLSSPVAMVAEMKDQAARGGRFFLHFLGLLSVSLGLFNLLPVPALDGIKMLFLTLEGATRRNLNAAFQVWVNAIGFMALLGLMAVLMARDVLHLMS